MDNRDATVVIEDRSIPKTVSMYPEQWALIEEINDRYGFRNISSALRFAVNDYRRLKATEGEPSSATVVGTTTAQ